jgi:hypothetical protein
LRVSALRTFKPLVTDDPASSTAYLIGWSPAGSRWFMAVTGDDREVRMSALGDVVTRILPGR